MSQLNPLPLKKGSVKRTGKRKRKLKTKIDKQNFLKVFRLENCH